jgi:hypothetical protein
MKRWIWPIALIIGWFSTACSQDGVYSGKLILGGQSVVETGHTEVAYIALGEGSLLIEPGARLEGDIYQLGGETKIEGNLAGSLSLFNGKLTLGPQAHITGDLLLGGGQAYIDPQATIGGEMIESSTPLPSDEDLGWFNSQDLAYRLALILGVSFTAYVIRRFFSNPLGRVSRAVRRHPVPAAAMGFLVFVVGLSLLVQMAFTVLLIPVSMLGLLLFGLAIGYGWTAVGVVAGDALLNRLPLKFTPAIKAGIGVFVVMLVLNSLALLNLGGLLAMLTISLVGLGAVTLTRFGLTEFVPANHIGPKASEQ